jgi:hypothetical protein
VLIRLAPPDKYYDLVRIIGNARDAAFCLLDPLKD